MFTDKVEDCQAGRITPWLGDPDKACYFSIPLFSLLVKGRG